MNNCYACLKYLVFLANFIMFTISVAILTLSIGLILNDQVFDGALEQREYRYMVDYYLPHYLLLCTGVIAMVLSFLGCCGANRSSVCLLATFFTCLLLTLISQIVVAGLLYFQSDLSEKVVTHGVLQTVLHKYHPNSTMAVSAWDFVQKQLECCGGVSPLDWSKSIFNEYQDSREIGIGGGSEGKPFSIPFSCCRPENYADCNTYIEPYTENFYIDSPTIYDSGCVTKLMDFFSQNSFNLLIAGIVIIVVEILGMISSMILLKTIRIIERSKP